MPLARIVTDFPEHAGTLAEELRRRGYAVEFSSPELAGKAPADLEIDFEICAEPDALSRASELAEQLHTDVAISPGTLRYESPRETEAVADSAGESLPVAEPFSAESWHGITAAEEPVRPAEPSRAESAEPVPIEPMPATDDWQEFAADSEQHHSQTVPPAETAFDDELDIARAAAQDNTAEHTAEVAAPSLQSARASEKVSEIAARAGEKSAAALQLAGVAAGALWASARHWTREFWVSARQRSQEYSERFQVSRAEMRAERQQKLLDLEKRRALAQERAAELEAAREAAAARLQELLRERGALTEAQPAPPHKMAAPPSVMPASKASVFSREIFARKLRLPMVRGHQPQLEAVLVGVAAACLLFAVGVAVASFHTRPAISNTFNQPSTPNGITVQGGSKGVTVKAGNPGVTLTPNAPGHSTAVAHTQSPVKPSGAIRQPSGPSDVTIRSFPSARSASPRTSGTDRVSDDVTIRHFGGASNPPSQTGARAELKHYSDLDN